MKRVLFGIFCMLFCGVCNSAQIVNVEYIHKLIEQQYGITVPYNSELTNPHVAANMKYLLTTIDAANSILNGEQITDYGTSEYATNVATDTVAALEMVRDHVRDYKFFATTTPDTTSFSFSISASGVFHIDWGDGTRESYRKNNTTATTYSHEYADAGEYVIKIGGYATVYKNLWDQSVIRFANKTNIAKIEGSIGAIFSTIKKADGTVSNPSFVNFFSGCTNLAGTIPPDLFKGIYGQPVSQMYAGIFAGCNNLTGTIPENLFGVLSGTPSNHMFSGTFRGCSGLIGDIPKNIFRNISGEPADGMYRHTFNGCSSLTGSIPENLFGDIHGSHKNFMFQGTFDGCKGLTGSIPKNLFGTLSGTPKQAMFDGTFSGCAGLSGNIPDGLFGYISGTPANTMFYYTFRGCSGLTGSIPENLFGILSGAPATSMFGVTFMGCSGLTGPSAKINGQYLYEIWPDATTTQVVGMYRGATGLTDYADIPSTWK